MSQAPANLLDHRRRRPTGVQRGVLIPEPKLANRRRARRATNPDHPAKEPATGGAKNSSLHISDEFGDDLFRRYAFASSGLPEPASQIVKVGCSRNRSSIQLFQVGKRVSRAATSVPEKLNLLSHRVDLADCLFVFLSDSCGQIFLLLDG